MSPTDGRDRRRRLSADDRRRLYARAGGLCENCGAELGASARRGGRPDLGRSRPGGELLHHQENALRRPRCAQVGGGTRTVPLDPITVQVLRDWQRHQFKERMAAGSKWAASGLVFTEPKGSPLRPEWIGARFDTLITKYGLIRRGLQAGKHPAQLAQKHNVPVAAVEVTRVDPLPPIRFHDLRHGAASSSWPPGST